MTLKQTCILRCGHCGFLRHISTHLLMFIVRQYHSTQDNRRHRYKCTWCSSIYCIHAVSKSLLSLEPNGGLIVSMDVFKNHEDLGILASFYPHMLLPEPTHNYATWINCLYTDK